MALFYQNIMSAAIAGKMHFVNLRLHRGNMARKGGAGRLTSVAGLPELPDADGDGIPDSVDDQ